MAAPRKTPATRTTAPSLAEIGNAMAASSATPTKIENLPKVAVYSTSDKQYPAMTESEVPEKVMNALREADGIIAASLPKIPLFKAEYTLFPSLDAVTGEWTFVLQDLRYTATFKDKA